jgi:hypothetical protein
MTNIQLFDQSIKNIQERSLPIPFGNSKYQMDSLVANEQTPERAYRHLLINFQKRYNDLKICSIGRRKAQNKVKQFQKQLETETDELKKEAILLDIEEITCCWEAENKLAEDCITELKYMQSMIEQLPAYTNEQFENGEASHFKLRGQSENKELLAAIKENLQLKS